MMDASTTIAFFLPLLRCSCVSSGCGCGILFTATEVFSGKLFFGWGPMEQCETPTWECPSRPVKEFLLLPIAFFPVFKVKGCEHKFLSNSKLIFSSSTKNDDGRLEPAFSFSLKGSFAHLREATTQKSEAFKLFEVGVRKKALRKAFFFS